MLKRNTNDSSCSKRLQQRLLL